MPKPHRSKRSALRDIRMLYMKELKSSLRERNIVIFSLILPFVLYPTILWAMFSAMAFVQGQQERIDSRIVIAAPANRRALADELARRIERSPNMTLLRDDLDRERATAELRSGALDAYVVIHDAPGALADNAEAEVLYDASKDRSVGARARFENVLAGLRRDKLAGEATEAGVDSSSWKMFEVRQHDVASSGERGRMLISLMLPVLLIVVIVLGSMYPAIEATAGERERSTWETSLTLGTSRINLLAAKYLHASTLATVAGLLNVVGIMLSIRTILAPLAGAGERLSGLDFNIGPLSILVLVVGTALLALFLAAGMMIMASFAKTFREAQSFVTPLYLASVLPMMFMQAPDLTLTPVLALVPIANLLLVFREAINGVYQWPLIVVTLLVELATIAGCLWLATVILRHEDFVTGSYEGSPVQFLRERVLHRAPAHRGGRG